MAKEPNSKQFLYGYAASFGFFCIGSSFGWSVPTRERILDGALGYPVSEQQYHFITAFLFVGGICSFIPFGILAKFIGTKRTMILATLPPIVGYTLLYWGTEIYCVYIGRVLIGCCGNFLNLSEVYALSIADVDLRGMMGFVGPLEFTIGLTTSYVLGSLLSSVKTFSLVCGVWFVLNFFILLSIPENPVFYILKGDLDKAKLKMLKILGEANSTKVNRMLTQISTDNDKLKFSSKAAKKSKFKAFYLAFILLAFQQLTGVHAVLFYLGYLFESATHIISPQIVAILYGSNAILFILKSFFLIDLLGRKFLLIFSSCFCCIASLIMAAYYFLRDEDVEKRGYYWVPMAGVLLLGGSFTSGLQSVPYILIAEIFEHRYQPICLSVCLTVNWSFGVAVLLGFVPLQLKFGIAQTFLIIASTSFILMIFSFYLIETKNKTLIEIQEMLGNKT